MKTGCASFGLLCFVLFCFVLRWWNRCTIGDSWVLPRPKVRKVAQEGHAPKALGRIRVAPNAILYQKGRDAVH